MPLPDQLRPSSHERIELPSGLSISLPKATPEFSPWLGPAEINTFGNKPLLDSNGFPGFAELVILRLFESAGWSGRWIEPYGAARMAPRLLTSWHSGGLKCQTSVAIGDPHVSDLLERIAIRNNRTFSGCSDVVAWHGDTVVFAESKLKAKDRLRATQYRWMEAMLAEGVSPESILVVEWTPASFSPVSA